MTGAPVDDYFLETDPETERKEANFFTDSFIHSFIRSFIHLFVYFIFDFVLICLYLIVLFSIYFDNKAYILYKVTVCVLDNIFSDYLHKSGIIYRDLKVGIEIPHNYV